MSRMGRPEHLKITQHKSHTEIDVLQPCEIHWSTDTIIWQHVLSEVPAGTKFRDFDAPESKPRNYRAMTNRQPGPVYYCHPAAARAFAELMAPWYGGDHGE